MLCFLISQGDLLDTNLFFKLLLNAIKILSKEGCSIQMSRLKPINERTHTIRCEDYYKELSSPHDLIFIRLKRDLMDMS